MKKAVNSLHSQLNKSGYICEERFALGISHAITTKPVGGAFLFGPAGTGKSYLPMMLAEILKRKLFFFQCSPGTREDDLVLKMLPSEETKSGIVIEESVVYESAVQSNEEEVILVLDEWDKTRPTADGFFLDFLQYGRLSIPGRSTRANLSNMLIFFTSNNERDISEALLRRFPKVDVNPLGVDIVSKALSLTHKGHPHIGNVLSLYHRTLQSGMTKPATIQEIRQLLDAVTSVNSLGAECDWDELVYMYITKTPENHELLRSAQDKDINDPVVNERTAIDVSAFGVIPTAKDGKNGEAKMPHLVDVKCIDASFEMSMLDVAPKDVTCMLEYDDDNYTDAVVHAFDDGGLTDNPADLHWATVSSGAIVSGKLRLLKDIAKYSRLLEMNTTRTNMSGEIMFVEPYVTYNNMCEFVSINSSGGRLDLVIKKATDKEIIGKWSRSWNKYEVDFRWTHEAGFEVIIPANTGAYGDFIYMCNNTGNGGINWYYGTGDGYAPEQSVMCMLSDVKQFDAYGEFTAKHTVGNKDYAYYVFNHSPAGCDRLRNYKQPVILESISSKVTRTSRLTTYKGKGFEVKLHNRIKKGTPSKWSIRITDTFDSDLLVAIKDWITYEANKFPLYVSIKAPGYAIGDELCSKYGWTRISDRLLSAKGSVNQFCILYEDIIIFVCCINHRRMSSDHDKANDMIKKGFKFLKGWRKAGSTLGK
mgnify:CR=1 FL=1